MRLSALKLSRRAFVILTVVLGIAAVLSVFAFRRYRFFARSPAAGIAVIVRRSLGHDRVSQADADAFATELDQSGDATDLVGSRIRLLATAPFLMSPLVNGLLPKETRGQLLRAQGHIVRLYVLSCKAVEDGRFLQKGPFSEADLQFAALYSPVEQPCLMSRSSTV